jgi:hypothetical protein
VRLLPIYNLAIRFALQLALRNFWSGAPVS